ncbi:alpha/beta hydrolase [Flagellimonas profundi]|uniref:Esterase family protein n=1 Tax=Flagellimonas profundi TaxID=2915620 RepID=A0ABS3FIS5_9FLAO|nr:alpha/beta hydrolase family protein [Allomuricauda profundi]MBO0343085.1 esterase family protein [Allomuricauda profundi]
MKKYSLFLLWLVINSTLFGQSKVLESQIMKSALLNTEVKYSIYLPDGYENSERYYPVVYLLNGYTGDETSWIESGAMQWIVDHEIEQGNIQKMVIVMPDGDDRLYMNRTDGTYPYEDMFMKELLPYIQNNYRIRTGKRYTGISGLSMGGAGSLKLALKYDEHFGACAAYSSAIFTEESVTASDQEAMDGYISKAIPDMVGTKGKKRLGESYREYDVLQLVKNKDPERLKTVKIYFDCGDDDFLTLGNAQLHKELVVKQIPHEYRVRDGAHTWPFWRESLPVGLKFISDSFWK